MVVRFKKVWIQGECHPLTLQELDMIMSEIIGHIVPSLPELRETKV